MTKQSDKSEALGELRSSVEGRNCAFLGLAAVITFLVTFFVLGLLTPGYSLLTDYISRLGAQGEPHALVWNLIGFGLVGFLFAGFGWTYGRLVNDRLVGICLVVCGVGFSVAALPTDFANENSPLSKAHYASICISLAGWFFALARLGSITATNTPRFNSANLVAVVSVLPMVGLAAQVGSQPIAHRLTLGIIFAWVVLRCLEVLQAGRATPVQNTGSKMDPEFGNG